MIETFPSTFENIPAYFRDYPELYREIDLKCLPKHVAIIMDGNGRWARSRGWERIRGHEKATLSVRESVRACGELGISVLSLFAFSAENWSRPKEEIDFLFRLFQKTLESELGELDAHNVRFRLCGNSGPLPQWLKETLDKTTSTLTGNTGLILNLAVNYGGKQDIVQAVNRAIERAYDHKAEVTEEYLEQLLLTEGLPPVDLMVRTSGELRISNFFLWQAAYAELYFPNIFWPDFRRQHLLEAVLEYQKRERRFGALQ